jgi:preprotein translocase subunit YajC
MNMVWTILAMAPPAGGEGQAQQSPAFLIGWFVIIMAIFYILMIRPQQKREKQRRSMLEAVKTGDRIVFAGMIGMVTNVKEKTLMVKIADGVKVEVLRGAVSRILDKGETPTDEEKA